MNIFGDDEIFRLGDFLAVYSRSLEEENGLDDTPLRIVNDLCGRKLATGKAVRIAKDLVAVTIDRNVKDTACKEETRAYFDGNGAYLYLIGRDSWFINLDITRDELFEAVQTVNSMEKLDTEKRNRLTGEYLDYIKMRRTYVGYVDGMTDDDPLSEEIKRCGDFPINLKPSLIKDKHDKIGRIVELIGCASQIEKYDARISSIREKESSDWEYRTYKYSIIMPENARDIINEGRQLNHCVGRAGYIEKMAEGNCRILFLRNNQDIHKPLITMEEVDGAIRQCYGHGDSINTNPEIRDFIKEYAEVKNLAIKAQIYGE